MIKRDKTWHDCAKQKRDIVNTQPFNPHYCVFFTGGGTWQNVVGRDIATLINSKKRDETWQGGAENAPLYPLGFFSIFSWSKGVTLQVYI